MAITLVSFVTVFAQSENNNTTSPYSRFGLGEPQLFNSGRAAGMGGVAIASRNATQLNLSNPASYTSIDTLSFIFEAGITGRFSEFEDSNNKQRNNNVNFHYFALNFPINKWTATAIGLQPYADMGYDILETQELVSNETFKRYFGSGTLSKVFIGQAFDIGKNLSVGVNFSYLFGNLTQRSIVDFSSSNSYRLSRVEEVKIKKLLLNYGIQYTVDLKKGHSLTLGATFEKSADIKAELHKSAIRSIYVNNTQITDTITVPSTTDEEITLPSGFGIGLAYNIKDKLVLGFDYYTQKWENLSMYGSKVGEMADLSNYAIGMEYIPNKSALRNYFKKVSYRIGGHYTKGHLKLNAHQINEYGITFGLGLPIYNANKLMHNSVMNISFELGKRGTIKDGLVRENYAKINLSFSLYDNWFIKRKFD